MQRIELNYGRGRLPVTLSDEIDLRVIRKRQMPVLPDPEAAVREALAAPNGAPPLAELARGKESACILICDITRPVPNGLFLPILLEQLLAAGLRAERITILVATGLHRPNEGEELAELVGSRWVLETVRVENHFARDDAAHVDLGTTRAHGVPVKLDRRLVEADLKIATGLVEPHFMAGYSGGRKVIAPGVAHKETITTFHSARFMEHPKAANCVLDGNPLHESQLEIVEMLGGALALNTVIDEERRLSFVNFGEIALSHLEAVAHAREFAEVPVAEQFQTVVTSAAGYPLDKTYYQTVKGMVAPMAIMAEGADLIIASACSEGLGSREFVNAQRRLVERGPDRFLEEIGAKRFADIDEWQTEMQLKPMRVGSIQLYSQGLPEADREFTGVEMIPSVEAAIEASVARSGDSRVAVIPEGPYVVPVYRPAA
ncbi:MAG TPA: nickel-dependent lactate racemase [Geminicoccaceae bacterium]|jgi:nickel-dependent lactate racemase|nr:nickel-dependent lactate racemase [Geminicoccaceae bacterium]